MKKITLITSFILIASSFYSIYATGINSAVSGDITSFTVKVTNNGIELYGAAVELSAYGMETENTTSDTKGNATFQVENYQNEEVSITVSKESYQTVRLVGALLKDGGAFDIRMSKHVSGMPLVNTITFQNNVKAVQSRFAKSVEASNKVAENMQAQAKLHEDNTQEIKKDAQKIGEEAKKLQAEAEALRKKNAVASNKIVPQREAEKSYEREMQLQELEKKQLQEAAAKDAAKMKKETEKDVKKAEQKMKEEAREEGQKAKKEAAEAKKEEKTAAEREKEAIAQKKKAEKEAQMAAKAVQKEAKYKIQLNKLELAQNKIDKSRKKVFNRQVDLDAKIKKGKIEAEKARGSQLKLDQANAKLDLAQKKLNEKKKKVTAKYTK